MEIIICDSDNVNAGKIKDICFQYSFQWEEESEIKIINAREEMYSYMKASNLTSLIIAETAIVKGEMISEKLKEQFPCAESRADGGIHSFESGFRIHSERRKSAYICCSGRQNIYD